jgi:hypothetical protein
VDRQQRQQLLVGAFSDRCYSRAIISLKILAKNWRFLLDIPTARVGKNAF